MIIFRLKTPVLLLILFAITIASAQAQPHDQEKQEPPAEVRSQLFKQVLSDFSDLRECIEKEEGGLRAAQENMSVETLDVNHDGVPEYEVQMSGSCACGMVKLLDLHLSQDSTGIRVDPGRCSRHGRRSA